MVIVDELVLDEAIEALAMGVQPRRLRIGTPVRKQQWASSCAKWRWNSLP